MGINTLKINKGLYNYLSFLFIYLFKFFKDIQTKFAKFSKLVSFQGLFHFLLKQAV